MSKRIASVRNVTSGPKAGAVGVLQTGMLVNSEILCLLGAKGRPKISVASGKVVSGTVRSDLVEAGRIALGLIVQELISDCFSTLITELRERIADSQIQESDEETWMARRFYLVLVAVTTGFQREFSFMTAAVNLANRQSQYHLIKSASMETSLGIPHDVVVDWKAVESAINLDSFKLVLDSMLAAREEVQRIKELELATTAVKEMMKMLQCMTVTTQSPTTAAAAAAAGVVGSPEATNGGDDATSCAAPCAIGDAPTIQSRCIIININPIDSSDEERTKMSKDEELGVDVKVPALESDDINVEPINQVGVTPNQSNCDRDALVDEDAKPAVSLNARENAGPKLCTLGSTSLARIEGASKDSSRLRAIDELPGSAPAVLSPREIALNMLEEVFEREEYLEAPSMLAKEFDPKVHSFGHLANTIELAFTFTATLLENEFSHITVSRKRKKRKLEATVAAASRSSEKPSGLEAGGDEDDGDRCSSDTDGLEDVSEIEVTDIIRRFAHPKALQHIALAVRAGMCSSSSISGSILPMPEGSSVVAEMSIVAKSLAVMQSVWRVVGSRERGAFRCAFYNYAMLHLFGIAMTAVETGDAVDGSVLEAIAEFGRTVTDEFFAMLTVNPSLLVDSLFFMDLSTQRMYANKRHMVLRKRDEEEMRARGELGATDDEDSGSDTDAPVKKSRTRRSSTTRKQGLTQRRQQEANELKANEQSARRRARVAEVEEEDVDDLDNLTFGCTAEVATQQ
jgi:hypothetical protein